MKLRQLNSTNHPIPFLLINSGDHVTGLPGISPLPTVTLNKVSSDSFTSASGNVVEVGQGWYSLVGNAHDRNTIGTLIIHASGTGADPFDDLYNIVNYDPFSSNSDSSNNFENLLDSEIISAV